MGKFVEVRALDFSFFCGKILTSSTERVWYELGRTARVECSGSFAWTAQGYKAGESSREAERDIGAMRESPPQPEVSGETREGRSREGETTGAGTQRRDVASSEEVSVWCSSAGDMLSGLSSGPPFRFYLA